MQVPCNAMQGQRKCCENQAPCIGALMQVLTGHKCLQVNDTIVYDIASGKVTEHIKFDLGQVRQLSEDS